MDEHTVFVFVSLALVRVGADLDKSLVRCVRFLFGGSFLFLATFTATWMLFSVLMIAACLTCRINAVEDRINGAATIVMLDLSPLLQNCKYEGFWYSIIHQPVRNSFRIGFVDVKVSEETEEGRVVGSICTNESSNSNIGKGVSNLIPALNLCHNRIRSDSISKFVREDVY